jgi:DNA (cytosine-5)-methyltransferase 1
VIEPLPFHVVDLFAGPGGLAEGFASVRTDGTRPFRIALSVEKDPVAHSTLRFRAFLRQFPDGYPDRYYEFLNGGIEEPHWAAEFPTEWAEAEAEALLLELGAKGASSKLEPLVDRVDEAAKGHTVVIGGPPCQAYSIVGRARNKGKAGYKPAKDERHFLYREYIAILERIRPTAFVMENVKGILSSSVDGKAIFSQVLADLRAIGGETRAYELLAFVRRPDGTAGLVPTLEPRDFIICAEDFGVPQARHRVIIIGVRRDALAAVRQLAAPEPEAQDVAPDPAGPAPRTTVRHVIAGLPALRSGLSRDDSAQAWAQGVRDAVEKVLGATINAGDAFEKVRQVVLAVQDRVLKGECPQSRTGDTVGALHPDCPAALSEWLLDPRLRLVTGHTSRGHMASDLARYLFVAAFAQAQGRSPVAREFPTALAPDHRNWDTGHFADRFRAQLWDLPSTTVTSHIAKDGHYFIHPDPLQCRALTVREAARLQTFPDNYRFLGNRTEQFVQVGNAVPPLLARQIAEALHELLSRKVAGPSDVAASAASQRELAFDIHGHPRVFDPNVLAFGSPDQSADNEDAEAPARVRRPVLRLKKQREARGRPSASRKARLGRRR